MILSIISSTLAASVLAVGVPAEPLPNSRPLIFGMNHTPMEWWKLDGDEWNPKLFKKMAEAGCTVCRIGVGWDEVEAVKGTYDWSEADRWVTLALENNIEPLILINSTPLWAIQKDYDPNMDAHVARYPADLEHAEDFSRYVRDLVRRYRGRVRYYEFWNEANGYGWHSALENPPSYGRTDLYTPWMIRAYKAVKLADPTAMMSTTGIDDNGTGHAVGYMSGIYENGGKGYFDAVADHPYSAGKLDAWKLDAIRAVLDAHGDTHVKVWLTEYGYPMDPNRYEEYQQHLKDFFDTVSQPKYDYVRISTWHTANEFPWEHGYGLTNKDLTPKPPYNTFKEYPKPARPVVSDVAVEHISPSSVRIKYKTDMDSRGLVMYGTDKYYGQATVREAAASKEHEAVLLGLTPNTEYHYRIRTGAVEDGDSFSADLTFTTQNGKAVRVVSGPAVSQITDSSAVITWTTDAPAFGKVEFGKDFAYGSVIMSSAEGTEHRVVITPLERKQNYQFRVVSTAKGYADSVVEGLPFTTDAGRVVSILSGPFVTDLTDSSATIKWTTDISSTSAVEYGVGKCDKSAGSRDKVTEHVVKLIGLKSLTRYSYQIKSSAEGNEDAVYECASFTTVCDIGEFLNGGFENGLTGWTAWNQGNTEVEANAGNSGGINPPNPATREFMNRLTLNIPGGKSGDGGLYQTIDCANGVYLISGWIAAGCDGDSEAVQMIGIDGEYSGGVPSGEIMGSLDKTSGWVYHTGLVEVTTGKLTVALRLAQSEPVGGASGYFDGLLVVPVKRGSIGELKSAALGQWVVVDDLKEVVAFTYNHSFVAQDTDGSAGIKVKTIEEPEVVSGNKVSFYGVRSRLGNDDIIDQAVIIEKTK